MNADENSAGSGPSLEHKTNSISELYWKCLEIFRALLSREDCESQEAISLLESDTAQIALAASRLQLWGEENRAVLPADARNSLDEAVRKDVKVKHLVCRILSRVLSTLDDIHSGDLPHVGSDTDASSSDEESTHSSADKDDETPNSDDLARIAAYRRLKEDIDSLFQLALLISRPGHEKRYLRSTIDSSKEYRTSPFSSFDRMHVEEKIRQWYQQSSVSNATAIKVWDEPLHESSVVTRLADANTKRREQLEHWSRYPDNPKAKPDAQIVPQNPGPERGETQELALPNEPKAEVKEEKTPSTHTRTVFSQVARSDLLETQTNAGPTRTVYAETSVASGSSHRVPDLPKLGRSESSFICPYCHMTLQSSRMRNRMEWKRHVYRDLRPYVCTFADCQSSKKQCASRKDWIYHESQMHRRQWVCDLHRDEMFDSQESFQDHIRTTHSENMALSQLSMLTKVSERAMDKSVRSPCPLCPAQLSLLNLERHLGEHQESIALFILGGPSDSENNELDDLNSDAVVVQASHMSSLNDEKMSDDDIVPEKRDDYRGVFVLMIKWKEVVDQLKTQSEVDELSALLEGKFGFSVQILELWDDIAPQEKLDLTMQSFFEAHDSAENLLLVYYTGHGAWRKGSESLEISATNSIRLNKSFRIPCKADFSIIHRQYLQVTTADLLCILDTSYGANLRGINFEAKMPHQRRGLYHLLSAAGIDETTCAPGPYSFTRTLIDALSSRLAEIRSDQTLSTDDLVWVINQYPSRHDSPCDLWKRPTDQKNSIVLEPLRENSQHWTQEQTGEIESQERTSLEVFLDLASHRLHVIYLAENLAKDLQKAFEDRTYSAGLFFQHAAAKTERLKIARENMEQFLIRYPYSPYELGRTLSETGDESNRAIETLVREVQQVQSLGIGHKNSGALEALSLVGLIANLRQSREMWKRDFSVVQETLQKKLLRTRRENNAEASRQNNDIDLNLAIKDLLDAACERNGISPDEILELREQSEEIELSLRQLLLDLLYYSEMNWQEESIGRPAEGTLQWLLNPDPGASKSPYHTKSLLDWAVSEESIFHISAPPGYGKSTVMRHLTRPESGFQKILEERMPLKSVLILKHFFFAGSVSQTDLAGLFRSLMYQLLQPDIKLSQGVIRSLLDSVTQAGDGDWRTLGKAVDQLLLKLQNEYCFCLLIDGIDEISDDGERDDFLDWLLSICKSSQIRACVSGRPLPTRMQALDPYPCLRLDYFTYGDVEQVVAIEIPQILDELNERHLALRRTIVNKSGGSLLRATSICRFIKMGIADGESLDDMERKIKDISTLTTSIIT